jgi:hypothetical protein
MINLNLPQADAWGYTLPPHSRFSKICFSFLCPAVHHKKYLQNVSFKLM